MKKMNPVVHFEMPAKDTKRMANFYSNVFGWQPQFYGKEMGNYVTITTSEADEKGRPKMPGTINGGFYPVKEDEPNNSPSIVVAVDNILESIERVMAAGGEILGEPVEIPEVGMYVSFIDTEGNKASILQPKM